MNEDNDGTMQQLTLFSPRIRARVRCPACRAVHIMGGGQSVGCCSLTIRLEETSGGGFITHVDYSGESPAIKPIPQIVGWVME